MSDYQKNSKQMNGGRSGGSSVVKKSHKRPCLSFSILNHLNLKKGTDTQSTTVEQEKNAMNFDISLNGLSVGVSRMKGESKYATEFHAEEVTLVLNKKMR
jgi:hypothetical protein